MAPIALVKNDNVQVTITEEAGKASLVVARSFALGGGDVKGFANYKGQDEIDLDGVMLEGALFNYLEQKYPAAAPALVGVKAIVDAARAQL